MIKLYNTLSRKKENFKPLWQAQGKSKNKVSLYTCGPTVYWYAHIGNLRTYLFEDILKKTLQYNKYEVNHIMNITDVGHLTSDADFGEDKMELGAKREKKTAKQTADFYTKEFKKDLKNLNIAFPDKWIKATNTIKEQINLIKHLERKGFTYQLSDGIYFDTSKIKNYGLLAGKKKKKIKAGARVKLIKGKRNLTDFALWKFSPKNKKRQMEWKSPWGIGFPGWHTECIAMAEKYLGIPFDIHCGGIDHIPIHHTNEIAQSEAAYKKNPAKIWMHGEFLILKQGRMGKSEGNIIILNDLIKKRINPLAYRYLCLTTHYRSKLTFSWESLKAAQNALENLYKKIQHFRASTHRSKKYKREFLGYINDDLDTPKALAFMCKLIKQNKASYGLLLDFDKIFGLGLKEIKKLKIPPAIKKLADKREKCRKEKQWDKADKIRKEVGKQGYWIEDTNQGPKIKKSC